MTLREAISTLPFEISEQLVDKVLIDAGLNGNMQYNSTLTRKVDLCMAELCRIKATEPDFSEGELSITINREAILKLRNDLLSKYSEADGGIGVYGSGGMKGDHELW
jgi:hypothetical protein